jgi:hypothetical protein
LGSKEMLEVRVPKALCTRRGDCQLSGAIVS